jgi:probable F420-dependent oxidoreductase
MVRCSVIQFATDRSMPPAELAQAVEQRGLDGIFFPEHTHLPVASRSPFFEGGEVPESYRRTCDPFIALAMAAAVTSRIRLGTGICLLTQHDPITLAKTIATLDHLSGGRVVLGVGAGWNRVELGNHGTPYEHRWAVLRERVQILRTIWREEQPHYHGEFTRFDAMWSYPKPKQAGGPPIWIGANSAYVPDRVADYADGWIPVRGRGNGEDPARLREACVRQGRRFEDLTLALFYAPETEADCRPYLLQGFHELIFALPSAERDPTLQKLDELANLADRLRAS